MRFKLALSTVVMVCTTAATALSVTRAFAGDAYVHHYRIHHHRHYYRDYSGYLDPRSGHYDPEFQRNRENFGFSGRDPSRVGGEDPSLHPAPMGH
ncbi:hypothetical protein [Bradyrhizobium sp.]|uniref:hypothetical protein n=1 Tax=Bradyrhizobium sp. TaxID=376 RepID=UPI0026146659|nr:hypothetical protein [Bradyrhizobium sp.]